jgi:hypothetical protein
MKFGYHSSQYNQQFSKQEEEKFPEVFATITSRMNELMKSGVVPSDQQVQSEVAKHYEFVCQLKTWQIYLRRSRHLGGRKFTRMN